MMLGGLWEEERRFDLMDGKIFRRLLGPECVCVRARERLVGLEFDVFKLHCKLVQQQAAIMAAASAAGGGAYIGAAPMAIATQIPPSALNGIASPGVVPSAQGPFQLFLI
jgi:hypothetical protein